MPLVLRPPTERETETLPDRLGQLGRTRRRVFLATAWFHLLALTLAVLAAACALDIAFHLPGVVRAALLVGVLATVGVSFLRGVRSASGEPVSPLAVALLLEERFPRLNDSLASAVDFLTSGTVRTSRFRRVTTVRAENLAARYNFGAIIPSGRAWKAFWLAALVVAVVTPLALLDTSRSALAVVRLADPFGKHPWPTKTRIELLEPTVTPDHELLLAKGEPFPLKFAVRGVIPEFAIVEVRLSENEPTEEVVPINPAEGATHSVHEVRLDAARVPRDFDFRILANDAETDWVHVTVAPAPRLVPLEGRPSPLVRLTYPEYTDLPPAALPDGTGVVEAVAGTEIHFRAAADRRIVSAVFRSQIDLMPLLSATACAPLATDNALGALAAQLLADAATEDIPLRITGPEGNLLEADFVPRIAGLYALRMTDERGLTGVRLFDFRMFPDPVPLVALERPVVGKDALDLLPTASVTILTRAEDRPYAVKTLFIEYRVGLDGPIRTLPLADLEAAGRTLPALAGSAIGVVRPKPVGLDGGRVVPLVLFKKPDGSAPVAGDTITLRTAATDWDDRTFKGPGRSKEEVEIRVHGRPSLEAQFQKQLAELRPALLRLKEDQRQAREKATEAAKAAAEGKVKPEDTAKITQAEQDQRQIRNQIADAEAGLRARAEQLRAAARANNLPKSPTTDKIEATANTLGLIADQYLEGADQALNAAKQEAEKPGPTGAPAPDPKAVADQLTKATRNQKAVEDGLGRLLERIEEWAGPGEVSGGARAIKEQVNRAGQQADKAAEKVRPGKDADKLTPAEKSDLGGAAEKYDAAAEEASKLIDKATRLAKEKTDQANALRATAAELDKQAATLQADAAKQTPGSDAADAMKSGADALKTEAAGLRQAADKAEAEATALRNAVNAAEGDRLPQDLRDAADELRKNNKGKSDDARKAASAKLDKLTESLGEKPAETGDELKKKQTAAGREIDKIGKAQDELRKQTKEAEEIKDDAKRAEELQKLAREQEKLRREAEQLAQQLTRDKQDTPADAVRRAAEQMEAARDELKQGKPAGDEQDDALNRLAEAEKKLKQEQKDDQEQLSREKREELMQQLKAIRDKQAERIKEADRIHGVAEKAKAWDRNLLGSLKDLKDQQAELAEELRAFTEKTLTDLPVFGRLATQSADSMERGAKYMDQRRDDTLNLDGYDADTEKVTHDRMTKPMKTALRRLDQILDSLKDDPKGAGGGAGGGDAGGGGAGGGDMGMGQPQGGGIPPLAQLKALRAMQAEVNEWTAAFAKAHPDPDKLSDDDKDELKELEQAQRDVAELFEKLADAFKPMTMETP